MNSRFMQLQFVGVFLLFSIYFNNSISAHATDLLQPCRVDGFAQQVQCGQIQRPLNPEEPQGKQIDIHFVVLSAKDKNKAPDPIFFIAGGPGQSAINVAHWVQNLFDKLNRRHDLVFVDQRGTGRSAPLNCPEFDRKNFEGIGIENFEVQQALKCKTELEKLPYGDLRFFTTSIAMQDLDAVRTALHYAQIDLIGISYGTFAALDYARQFPSKVRRTILDGVTQLNRMQADDDTQETLNKLVTDCEADQRCQHAYPRLKEDWKKLLASLPQNAKLTHPRLGSQLTTTITKDDLAGWVTKIIYSPVTSAGLPFAITQASKGNFNPLLALSGTGNLPNPGDIAEGMHFSVMCSDGFEFTPHLSIQDDFRAIQFRTYSQVCSDWPRGKVPKGFRSISQAATPVLLLSGGIDPVTPPFNAALVAKSLGNKKRHLILNNAGHGMLQQTCLSDVATNFINAKTDKEALDLDSSCVKQIPRPTFWIAP
jgi:pimeloyl-ACP methyl ester carboxylesterase